MAMALRGEASPQAHRLHQQPTTSSASQSSQKLPSSLPTQMSLEEQSYQHHSILQYQQQHPQSLPPSATFGQQQRSFFPKKHPKNFYSGCTTTTSTMATDYRMAASEHNKQVETQFTGENYDNPKEELTRQIDPSPRDEHFTQSIQNYPVQQSSQLDLSSTNSNANQICLVTLSGTLNESQIQRNHGESDAFLNLSGGVLSDTNLYIRGLQEDCTDEKLYEMCAPYGKIVSTKAILDKLTRKCRGYGFVDFDSRESALAAISGLPEWDNRIHAQMAKQQEQDPTNLYIANLPSHFDEEKLSEMLQVHGPVISSRILRNLDGSSRGVGFCRMTTSESCASIIDAFHGKRLAQGLQPLIVKLADSTSRKLKRSTPSLHSFYNDDGRFYKAKLPATPLLSATTPLMDPIIFPAMSNSALAAFSPVLANCGRLSASQYTPQHYGPIADLNAQFNQLRIANGPSSIVGTSDSTVTPGQTPRPLPSLASTDLPLQHLQQQQTQQMFQPSQQQQAAQLVYPPYYGVQYYMPAAFGAAASNYQQPFIADYYSLASQQQQLSVASSNQFANIGGQVQQNQPIASLFPSINQQQTTSASNPQYGNTYTNPPLNIGHHIGEQQQHQPPPLQQVQSTGGNNFNRPQQQPLLTPVHTNAAPHLKQQQRYGHHMQQPHWVPEQPHSHSMPPTNVTTCTKP
uniref:RRM domain-containing protein n=1 Tax=Meloidogyne floridensis TaxID=298350 RepID=A0A915NYE7_9BILA